jgi:hypothetical protein
MGGRRITRLDAYEAAKTMVGHFLEPRYSPRAYPEIAAELKALDAVTPDKVDAVLARHGEYARVQRTFLCDVCGQSAEQVVYMDEESDSEHSAHINVCARCLLAALEVLEG